MNKVVVVSAFVPLKVKHMTAVQYHDLGGKMFQAARDGGAATLLFSHPLEECWSFEYIIGSGLQPATPTPADRYETAEDHLRSHVVNHTRTQWAMQAAGPNFDLGADVVVWLDYGILKQGVWNGNPITPDDVSAFVEKVKLYPFDDIPFPGIARDFTLSPFGNNWRFCGSTHIWPVKWLEQIDRSYHANLLTFMRDYKKVPLDLAIWPLVEQNSGLPFRFYQAEYDASQLRNFPCTSS